MSTNSFTLIMYQHKHILMLPQREAPPWYGPGRRPLVLCLTKLRFPEVTHYWTNSCIRVQRQEILQMTNMYLRPWGGAHPGCLIFLLDQSGSMSDPFGPGQAGGGKRKCDMVATILNSFLNELIVNNTIDHNDGTTEVRP